LRRLRGPRRLDALLPLLPPIRWSDPSGRDVWIEGPSGSEPQGHLSLAIGDPNGSYTAFSFGADSPLTYSSPFGVAGTVYEDTTLGGAIQPGSYLVTSPAEDAEVVWNLRQLVGGPNPFTSNGGSYTIGNTCRDFTRENWSAISGAGVGTPAPPPFTPGHIGNKSSSVPFLSSSTQD